MTDRHTGYVIVLEKNMRDDDARTTIDAIKHIRGVLDVKPIINTAESMIAETRAERVVQQKVLDALFPQHKAGA